MTANTQIMTTMTIGEMRDALLDRSITPEDLTLAHLKRIEETDELNSFITLCADEALIQAESAARLLEMQGDKTSLLCGIPVGIKDQLVTKGVRTTCGSKMLESFIPPYDCTAVKKLKDAGAVVIGKTNQDEFAMGSSSEHSAYGPVKNPWGLEYVPGGSSGGSAASVAAGQVAVSLGTDTGGSIRQPAGLCGVYGLKPTYGRVSRYGAIAFASSLDQIGPFARSVADLAITASTISGHDPLDSTSVDREVPSYADSLSMFKDGFDGFRIGVPTMVEQDGMDKEVLASFNKSKALFEKLGAEIVPIELPHCDFALAAYYITAPAEASSNLARFDGIRYGYRTENFSSLDELYERTRSEGFGAEVKRRIMVGSYVLSAGYYDAYYKKAQQVRTLIINDYAAAFANKCDVILTPVSPTPAFKLGEKTSDPLMMYLADIFTVPINLAGLPGMSIPFSRTDFGMPVGIQIVGPAFSEEMLFGVAGAIEGEIGFPLNEKASGSL